MSLPVVLRERQPPETDREWAEVAQLYTTALDLALPTVLDKIDDPVAKDMRRSKTGSTLLDPTKENGARRFPR